MSSVALLAKQAGYNVKGYDDKCLPPISDHLVENGIQIDAIPKLKNTDLIIVGNALHGNSEIANLIRHSEIPILSAPHFLYMSMLSKFDVIAVSGTHGKTTTTSVIAWIMKKHGFDPSYLIAGIPQGPDYHSCHLGSGNHFVIESDEYDTAYFDKRPKFLHYHPKFLVINNLDYDHADIYKNKFDIAKEFQKLVNLLTTGSYIIYHEDPYIKKHILNKTNTDGVIVETISTKESSSADWKILNINIANGNFSFQYKQKIWQAKIKLSGMHNILNAMSSIAICNHISIPMPSILNHLNSFSGVARRLQLIGHKGKYFLYDDFAHHPRAIKFTAEAVRARHNQDKILAVIECSTYTMKFDVCFNELYQSVRDFDFIIIKTVDKVKAKMCKFFSDEKIKNISFCSNNEDLIDKLQNNYIHYNIFITLSSVLQSKVHDFIRKKTID
jgi:UDP-N-acetylmuramate: L-alanyl-gamma-D-glutamyl-meso-diaminopimelate ligase